ncbi:hypothetical protein I4U23_016255 [Adineta vaga]|nr:hypothetical protein I4U23_016255 [Adineta vaga]
MSTILFLIGIINCLLIFLIFLQEEYRRSPCTIYIITKTIYDIIGLFITVFMRSYTAFTDIDPSQTNEIWCRARISLFYVTGFGSLTCICLTGFDQWMSTSRSVRRRNLSSKRFAFYAIFISFLISILFTGIPMYIIIGLVGTPKSCGFATLAYADYASFFFFPVIFGILPVIIPIIFGLLTYRNVRLLQHPSIPYAIYYLYMAITRRLIKDSLRIAQENVAMSIIRNLFYINYCYSFYIFVISSNEIRKTLKRLILRIFLQQQNEITINNSNRQIEPVMNNRNSINPVIN